VPPTPPWASRQQYFIHDIMGQTVKILTINYILAQLNTQSAIKQSNTNYNHSYLSFTQFFPYQLLHYLILD